MSLKSKLKKRKADYVDLVFCLDRPLAKELEHERLIASRDGAYSAGKSPRVKELEKQVSEASVTIRISSMEWGAWNELVAEHPPREGTDEALNSETFYIAAAKATAVEVTAKSTVPIPDEDWEDFVAGLTDGEHDRIAGAVIQVNRHVGAVDIAPLG